MAIISTKDEFSFSNGNTFKMNYENCDSYNDIKSIFYNGKKVRSFKGVCRAKCFFNKKNELDGIVVKIKDKFNLHYYIVANSENTFVRNSTIRCFELIPSLQKDKKNRIKELEDLIV